ncbi:MIT domain-containing protein 1 [Bulinus truncatus]|nr:MIT domain-containing protein 1 [Bulinus truncatus]
MDSGYLLVNSPLGATKPSKITRTTKTTKTARTTRSSKTTTIRTTKPSKTIRTTMPSDHKALKDHKDHKDHKALKYHKDHVKRESQKPEHQQRRQEYADSPEDLNGFLKEEIAQDQMGETIYIGKDSTGHSYESLFGKYLNVHVTSVEVQDPYILDDHQVENFRIICDLIVGKKIPVQTIKLVTWKIKQESKRELKEYLRKQKINLEIEIKNFHDRKIRLSTGWVFHLGRGLDFFEKSGRSPGDFDQWPCKETTVILKIEKEGKT